MNGTENLDENFKSYLSSGVEALADDIASIKWVSDRTLDTSGSQGFVGRLATMIMNIYNNYHVLSEKQFFLVIGAIIGGLLTMHTIDNSYRVDRSTTLSTKLSSYEWARVEPEELIKYVGIEDQPHFSYNDILKLAQDINFPTSFDL